jgi:hypothetical protein
MRPVAIGRPPATAADNRPGILPESPAADHGACSSIGSGICPQSSGRPHPCCTLGENWAVLRGSERHGVAGMKQSRRIRTVRSYRDGCAGDGALHLSPCGWAGQGLGRSAGGSERSRRDKPGPLRFATRPDRCPLRCLNASRTYPDRRTLAIVAQMSVRVSTRSQTKLATGACRKAFPNLHLRRAMIVHCPISSKASTGAGRGCLARSETHAACRRTGMADAW